MASEKPNPGSPEAREQGCICPHYDNNGGRFAPRPPDGWVIVVGCPVHREDAIPERATTNE